jgi:glycerol kinase
LPQFGIFLHLRQQLPAVFPRQVEIKKDQVIASGGALLRSKVWQQMMVDALGHSIVECTVPETSSRGAAIIAAEQMGCWPR